jgi:peptidoglycan/LPS O-acetylase OafA/YrhL
MSSREMPRSEHTAVQNLMRSLLTFMASRLNRLLINQPHITLYPHSGLYLGGLLGCLVNFKCVVNGMPIAFEFLAGVLLADLHLSKGQPSMSQGAENLVHLFVHVSADYVFSWPARPDDTTLSFTWFQNHVPSPFADTGRGNRIWFSLAAFGVVSNCSPVRIVMRMLESSPPQYLGHISFAFCILQHPVLDICEHSVLGTPWQTATADKPGVRSWGVRGLIGQSTLFQRTICWFIELGILDSMLICMADFFWRVVDMPFVKLARNLEGMAFAKDDDREIIPTEQ